MTFIHKLVLFLVTALSLALASPTSDPSTADLLARAQGGVQLGCGTEASDDAFAASKSNFTQFASKYSHKSRKIRVYWHVVYNTQSFNGGYLTNNQIRDQIEVLNTHFHSSDISFKLKKIDRTQNSNWYFTATESNPAGVAMRQALHEGGYDDLNIYSLWYQPGDRGGYSTWPWNVKLKPKLDGVFLQVNVIRGGPLPQYNQGKILVHQVGHWCGLFHTFQGGCNQPGDFVSDTPLEAVPHYGCPTNNPNTCPTGGSDPIHNFMDYTNDPCKTHFTKGQGAYMRFSLDNWRS
ncbi:hypothetical protein BDV93DRAFT_610229 [Ceratobasidium sp. AG-I]|nr:hypothetical protein BDV93DRAFT_610229 [Ceratobasidium sp. AG-I]